VGIDATLRVQTIGKTCLAPRGRSGTGIIATRSISETAKSTLASIVATLSSFAVFSFFLFFFSFFFFFFFFFLFFLSSLSRAYFSLSVSLFLLRDTKRKGNESRRSLRDAPFFDRRAEEKAGKPSARLTNPVDLLARSSRASRFLRSASIGWSTSRLGLGLGLRESAAHQFPVRLNDPP